MTTPAMLDPEVIDADEAEWRRLANEAAEEDLPLRWKHATAEVLCHSPSFFQLARLSAEERKVLRSRPIKLTLYGHPPAYRKDLLKQRATLLKVAPDVGFDVVVL